MAPKAKRSTSNKKIAKSVSDVAGRVDHTFILELGPHSEIPQIQKMIRMMGTCMEKKPIEAAVILTQALFEACGRICATEEALQLFMEAGAIDMLRALVAKMLEPPEEEREECFLQLIPVADASVQHMAVTAARWIPTFDHVDFTKLPVLTRVANAIGHENEAVGFAVLDAVRRYAGHRGEYTMAMLQDGILKPLHLILASHRAPEMVTESLEVIYRVTDLPQFAFVEHVRQELGLVQTVCETLGHAPVNMRLQLLGLKLLVMWAQAEDEEIDQAISEAGALAALKKVEADLRGSGLSHMAAWMTAVAHRALDDIDKKAGSKMSARSKGSSRGSSRSRPKR